MWDEWLPREWFSASSPALVHLNNLKQTFSLFSPSLGTDIAKLNQGGDYFPHWKFEMIESAIPIAQLAILMNEVQMDGFEDLQIECSWIYGFEKSQG